MSLLSSEAWHLVHSDLRFSLSVRPFARKNRRHLIHTAFADFQCRQSIKNNEQLMYTNDEEEGLKDLIAISQ